MKFRSFSVIHLLADNLKQNLDRGISFCILMWKVQLSGVKPSVTIVHIRILFENRSVAFFVPRKVLIIFIDLLSIHKIMLLLYCFNFLLKSCLCTFYLGYI